MFELFVTVPAALLASYIGVTYFTGTDFEIVEIRLPETLIEKGHNDYAIAEKIDKRFNEIKKISTTNRLIKLDDSGILEQSGGAISGFFNGMAKVFHEFEEVRMTSAYMGLLPNAVTIDFTYGEKNDLTMKVMHAAPFVGDDFEEVEVTGPADDLDGLIGRALDEFLHQNYPSEYFDLILHRLLADSQISTNDTKLLRKLMSEMLVRSAPTDLFELYIEMAMVELIDGRFDESSMRSQQAADYLVETDPRMVIATITDAAASEFKGDFERSELLHIANIKNFPHASVAYIAYGSFQKRRGRLDQAEAHVITGLELLPDNPRYLALLADLKLAKGDYAAAAKILKDATLIDPEDELIKQNLQYSQTQLDPSLTVFHDETSIKKQTMCLNELMCFLIKTYQPKTN